MASTKLTRTPASNGNSKTWTWSAWVKLSEANTEYVLFHNFGATTSDEVYAKIGGSSGTIEFALRYGGTYEGRLITNRKFKDVSGWYNFVFVCDTPNATAGDRQRIYVNGVEETSFSTDTQIAQDAGTVYNQTYEHTIGSYGSGNYFNGSMTHINAIDGTAYDASYFGSTDTTTGEWEINTSPSVTYGTNGYFILKNGNSVTDESGNANNWTVASGTLTKTEDCPSNVFSTMNPLDNYYANMTFSQGANTTVSDHPAPSVSTLGMTSGKYYFEAKAVSSTSGNDWQIGIVSTQVTATSNEVGNFANDYGYYGADGNYINNNSGTSYGNTYTAGDVIGCAVDLTNNKLYFSKNGTWQASGDPTSGSTGTGAISITAPASTPLGVYLVAVGANASANSYTWSMNFGNGYFGTTAVTSAGTSASTPGIFEYDVPTGYEPLSTKGLNA
tara:strand:- start:386 stop:1717 length:1332 start_codon:yes stop_codon:yes gene_type:complete